MDHLSIIRGKLSHKYRTCDISVTALIYMINVTQNAKRRALAFYMLVLRSAGIHPCKVHQHFLISLSRNKDDEYTTLLLKFKIII